jgi:hypothetical protein
MNEKKTPNLESNKKNVNAEWRDKINFSLSD